MRLKLDIEIPNWTKWLVVGIATGVIVGVGVVWAAGPSPAQFAKDEVLDADKMNKNFNDLHSRISTLETGVAAKGISVVSFPDFAYSGTPGAGTATTQTLSLPSAGSYLVFYNARSCHSGGTRGDQFQVQLLANSGSKSPIMDLAGGYSQTDLFCGGVTLIHPFETQGPDTVTVWAFGSFGGTVQLLDSRLGYIRQ